MNGVLLDTHTIIWMVSDEGKLGQYAKELVFQSTVKKFISPASYWELAIKIKLGKLVLQADYDEFVAEAISDYALEILHVQPRHTSVLTKLDLFHSDPFDRLLIAQASIEDIPILSIDRQFDNYPVERIWDYADETTEEPQPTANIQTASAE
jgi:PIN domain nuclease of toxin-antitoxin system